ncbi:leucine-rich repeat and coiled-coil domain-containing protein 1 isoform X1 [Bufo gargarizans]|uniref:leucine-rich repeat and coiled-coil domain-containing protein 1 isoform X1 n=1 Tax=Bufo gargarizans TaxID=30331 RepID=UPI001CF4132B|nr:leucine-rich repeat and coiled-coil domain-containing protein 1 isoform X1 [Bufo gargarizans]
MADEDHDSKDLSLMDKRITSLLDISLHARLLSLNLHCNQISRIEGLSSLHRLQHLDLSSNLLSRIEGLDALISLQSLNLSCNRLTAIEGLQNLINLKKVNLSYNRIDDLSGLIPLHGRNHKLSHLYLHSNCISGLTQVLHGMMGLHGLVHLTLEQDGKGNPVCCTEGYRDLILGNLPQLKALDGISRSGESVIGFDIDSADLPNLEFLEYLITCDNDTAEKDLKDSTSVPVVTPQIDKVLSQYRKRPVTSGSEYKSCTDVTSSSEQDLMKIQDANNMLREMRIKKLEDQISELLKKGFNSQTDREENILKPKRDTDLTTESDCESSKENVKTSVTKRSKIPNSRKNSQSPKCHSLQKNRTQSLSSVPKQSTARKEKSPSSLRRKESPSSLSSDRVDGTERSRTKLSGTLRSPVRVTDLAASRTHAVEESTYRALVQELDQERERRWKAEQLVVRLTENIKGLQSEAKEEKDINSMAMYTTDRIKELLLKEKNAKTTLQALVHQLREENGRLANEIKQFASREDDHQRTLKKLEDAVSRLETQRIQQEALEMKHMQEAERKVSASHRENELLRASVRQHKDKVKQLHELLTSREQAHRKELDTRVSYNGPEFQEAVAKEVSRAERLHIQQIKEFQEKMNALSQQYTDLEDEFRAALVIESGRFKEVKEAFDTVTAELAEHKEALCHSRLKAKQSASLIQELTTMVKEQKTRIADITKAKQETISSLKSKIRNLEILAEEEKRKTVQIELLKQEKSKLISQLTAQESLIDGLKAERKIWGQELSQQGVALAQDRGRLEAKIEVLSTEIETLKKQNERDNDALRIKSKMVDDQTETIRKLKEGLQERDERIRKLRAENLEMERTLREQNDEREKQFQEVKEKLERQTERKEEIKLHLEEKEAELLDVKKAYSAMNTKWQDKAELLSQLETQVRQMKENFDAKEKKLIEDRDKSLRNHKVVMEKLHSVDDAFRRQLESILAAHQAELVKVANEKQKEIDVANEKVYQVEEEMRQLLRETANSKRAMEEKIKRLTSALCDIQQDL